MKKQFSKIQIKRILKSIVEKIPILKQISILAYKALGRKPWSFGYSVYKDKMIKDTINNSLAIFNEDTLPPHYGFGIDERIVEYPWLFSRLKKEEEVLLDAGATLNHFEILKLDSLREKKLHVLTLHPEVEHKIPSFLTYKYEDMRKTSFNDDFFDAIVCLSTLEHVGMDNTFLYTPDENKKENDQYAFLGAVREFKRILKKGGVLYLSVPYGRYENHRWFQNFDSEMISRLKDAFDPAEGNERYFKYDKAQWNNADCQSCNGSQYFDIHKEKRINKNRLAAAESVVCLELVK